MIFPEEQMGPLKEQQTAGRVKSVCLQGFFSLKIPF